jgi:hypothetical protein
MDEKSRAATPQRPHEQEGWRGKPLPYTEHRRKLAIRAAVGAMLAPEIKDDEARIATVLAELERHGYRLIDPSQTAMPADFVLAVATVMPPSPVELGDQRATFDPSPAYKATAYDHLAAAWRAATLRKP